MKPGGANILLNRLAGCVSCVIIDSASKIVCRQIEGGFAQPNGIMCQHMLSWAIQATQGRGKGLLELYCGNGNFTVALANNFE